MPIERPDPDALLARVRAEESRGARGRLKIFFGMAPGVGKTYAMLEAARKIGKEGVDVVIGYVEPHARPETHALVMGLDLLAKKVLPYRGRTLAEFDLEAALARKPQLILVDELAHTNAEGCTHARRWQDVEDLLAAGIDVYTTLNVQHLESLNDVVAQVTTIPVRETVPDHVFEQADEVELVDIAPDDLIQRLKDGKVYVSEQALRAIENFFRKGNLIALREMALRKTADRVSAQALDYRQQNDVARIWHTSDRLLVCVGPSPMSARLVRATRRMAAAQRIPWTTLHVELENAPALTTTDQSRLEENLRLAEELGASVAHTSGAKFAECVLRYSREHNITQIIVGKPLQSRWQSLWRGAIVYDLIRDCGDVDVYVISGDDDAPVTIRRKTDLEPMGWQPYLIASTAIVVCTMLCLLLPRGIQPTNVAMIYFAFVVGVALKLGRGPSIFATVAGVLAFDVIFVPPYFQLAVSDSQYLLTFAVMLVIGILVNELAARVRRQSIAAQERERRTASLLSLSRELSQLPTRDAIAQSAKQIISRAFDADVSVFVPDLPGGPDTVEQIAGDVPAERDQGVIRWVAQNRQMAGAGTETLPGTESVYLPLLLQESLVGLLGVRLRTEPRVLQSQQMQLLQAFASQLAAALERCSLAVQAEEIRMQAQTERLRNSLLSAVSHDLRTPLATISGAAEVLSDNDSQLKPDARRELAESIVDEADRLHRLVANLLDLTRLEAGAIQLKRELQPIEEVIGVVLKRMDRPLRDHPVETAIDEHLPPVPIDDLLIQQLLMNLLDNAAKFSSAGNPVSLVARQQGNSLVVEVADRGPGLPPGEELQIFDKFHRGTGAVRSGSGIGLAICRGVVELHGGKIIAENRPGGGAVFRFSLPLEESS